MNLYSIHALFDLCPQGILVTDGTQLHYYNEAARGLLAQCGYSLPLDAEQEALLMEVLHTALTCSRPQVLPVGVGLLSVFSYPLQTDEADEVLSVIQLSSIQLSGLSGSQLSLIARRMRDTLSASMMALDFLTPSKEDAHDDLDGNPDFNSNIIDLFPSAYRKKRPVVDHYATIRRGQYRLLRTATELQLLAELIDSKENFPLSPMDLCSVIQELFWDMAHQSLTPGLELGFQYQDLPPILGYAPLLRHLFLVLISSAIQCGANQFTVDSALTWNGCEILLLIRHNGSRLSDEAIGHADYPLLSDSNSSAQLQNTLSICRQIAQLHGGTFLINSDPSKTSYTLTLPITHSANTDWSLECEFFDSPYGDPFVELADVLPNEMYAYPIPK